MGKHGLEIRGDSILKQYFSHFLNIKSPTQGTKRIFNNTNSPQKWKLFDCDLCGMNEACTYGQEWLWMPRQIKSNTIFFKFSEYQNSDARKKSVTCETNFLHKFEAFGGDHDGKYQTYGNGEWRDAITRWNTIKIIIWNIGLSVLWCKQQSRRYSFREILYNLKTLDWDLDRRSRACSFGWKKRLSLTIEKKLITQCFCSENWDCRDPDATGNINGFSAQYSFSSVTF